jgi:Novel toxin 15
MSGSPAAAQAGAGNQRFWNGIAKLPEEAQKSFWDAGVALSGFIGENPKPFVLAYDTTRPPPGAAWWEKALFYVGQSQYNQAVANAQTAQAMADGAGWLWGALQGDFNKNPTTGQVVTGGIISMIPIVDQVCDVRDIVANCLDLSDEESRKDNEKWIALGLTCVGFVPEFGSAVKTVAKTTFRSGTHLLDLLKHMEWIEKSYKQLKIACPWGFAPIEWLRKYDFVGEFRRGGAAAKKAFENALVKTEAAVRYAIGSIKARLVQLVDLFKAVIAKIVETMVEIGRKVKAKVDGMLGKAKKEAGNYDAAAGKAPNTHAQGDKPPPKGPNRPHRMDPHKPKCFKPGEDLRKNWKGDPNKLEKEFYDQLKGQEAGLNKMTVGEYLDNRARYETVQRAGTGGAQQAARDAMEEQISESIKKSLRSQGIVGRKATDMAQARTDEIMGSLAALHDPDLKAGGADVIRGMGNANVNSSLGSQWSKGGRVEEMDKAAREALAKYGPDAKMNVTLERCKG